MLMLYRIVARRVLRGKRAGAGPATRLEPKREVDTMVDSFGSDHPLSTEMDSDSVPHPSERMAQAEMVVKDHMMIALGVGIIPVPLVDLVAAFGSQVWMVQRLCGIYGVKFSENLARSLIMSLVGTLSLASMAIGVGFSFGKMIPGAGTLMGMLSLPIMSAALSYSIGKIFIGHFELGGTLVDFDPRANGVYFRDLYQRGKSFATDLARTKKSPSVVPAEGPVIDVPLTPGQASPPAPACRRCSSISLSPSMPRSACWWRSWDRGRGSAFGGRSSSLFC
jgi:uncharacterized protein (DUF697 family)